MSDPTDNENQPVTVIIPGSPSGATAEGASPSRGSGLRWLAIGALCLMLLVLAGVIVVLPDLVADREPRDLEPPAVAPPVAPPPATTEDAKRVAREKREAERLLGVILRAQTELEAEGVAVWGGEDYDAAVDSLAAGDAALQEERYVDAARDYRASIAGLESLRASMPERLAAALEAGEAALAAEQGPEARERFEVALAIDPRNARAQQGMESARVLEEVLALVEAGALDESRDELDAAREKYAAALALDSRSKRARDAHDGVTARIRERDYRAAMSAALVALEEKAFDASRAALARAEALAPNSADVADARRRLALAVQRDRIETHRRAARTLERAEQWRKASEHYAAVLGIDSNATFARHGKEKSLARARIHAELDAYLAALGRLSAPGPRDNARRLIAAAADADPATEPELVAKVEKLEKAIEVAETPMKVRIQSDNLTDVTVHKVGRFGRFASRELLLPPGTYVAVGTRTGYRDVRVEFTLTAGQEPASITVRCQERI